MTDEIVGGYCGKLLRVDLSHGNITEERLNEAILKKWVGGAGLGAKYLYEETPPGVEWSDAENRLIWTTGPLAGSGVMGAANFNVTTKGPMTNLAVCSQANGFFGAYLKFSGFDGLIFQGRSPNPVYLWIKEGQAEIRDAASLVGRDIWEVEDMLRRTLGVREHDVSIFAIGPAGENLCYFATIAGDRGHVVSKNGVGAVMGAKNLQAVVTNKGPRNFSIHDPRLLKEKNRELFEFAKNFGPYYKWGTGGGFSTIYASGALPVKNYTTNLYPEHEKMNGQYMRAHFKVHSAPCYKCGIAHVKEVTVTEGPYTGFRGEEPEYEQLAAWGPQIGNTDVGAVVMLVREVDKLGLDCNEAGWAVGWAMECFEKGVFTKKETDGLELTWGNVEAVRVLLNRISRREGYLGHLLADGVMRAAKKLGGKAAEWAVYVEKGVSPRTHDHRARWAELFDSCVANTSTIESSWAGYQTQFVDMPALADPFSHQEVSTINAKYSGIRMFDDCLGTCRIASPHPKMVLECLNAVTGWHWKLEDAFTVGRRIINLLRIFNLRHGMKVEDEKPSVRYGSIPADGPAQGKNVMEKWPAMTKNYYQLMGWDAGGKPLIETIEALGLSELVPDLKSLQ